MAFNAPISSQPPLPTPSDWVRPADWITIVDTPNEVQFLVADTGVKAFAIQTTFIKNSGTNIYIDWGDGVVDTISTNTATNTNHVYSTGGTPCSRGYNTFKIRIYSDATCVITNARHISNFSTTGGNPYYNIGLLEAYFGDNTCNTTEFGTSYFLSNNNSGFGSFQYLEYVKLPNTVTWTSQMASMFRNCSNLFKIIMPISASSLTDISICFNSCANLRNIILPSDSINITTFSNTFSFCTFLRTISFPTTLNSVTTFNSTFNGCASLKNITLPSINLAITFSNMVVGCTSLQWFKFTSLPSPISPSTSITFPSFTNLVQLQNVYFPSTCSTNALYSMASAFSGCVSLKNIAFPTNFNASTLSLCFNGCRGLTNVILPTSMPSLNNFSSCFNGCVLLQSIALPTTVVATTINMAAIFQGCISLSTVTIPSTWNINSLLGAFYGCVNLKTVILPNNAQNSIGSMGSCFFNCNLLESVIMPTSLNSVTSLDSAFYQCYNLKSVVLPATMNNVTTMSLAFFACFNLTSVTLPTSMSSCTNLGDVFANCYSLKSLTMPATVSASATVYSSLCSGAINLQTLSLPLTQTSLLTNTSFMFNACGNLTTITNLDKVGSLTATPLVNGLGNNYANLLTSLSFNCPFSVLTLNGQSATNFNKLSSLRFLNTSTGQWIGTSPQINISYCDMPTTALNILFADIAAQGSVTTKTINITGCTGAAGLTAADRLVITSRGWAIIG